MPQDFLTPPPERRYVRSFLFTRRVNAPFVQVHLLARIVLVLCLSGALLRTINTAQPDYVGGDSCSGWRRCWYSCSAVSVQGWHVSISCSRYRRWWPSLSPGSSSIQSPAGLRWRGLTIYSGQLSIGLAPWQAVLIAIVALYFLWTRKLFLGIVVGIVVAFALAHWVALPALTLTEIHVFHPLTLLVSTRGLLVAGTKVIGYAGMIMVSIALVMTARDTELIGMLRQLRVPSTVIFFLSTVFRSLELALSDYETIHQAQLARAVAARPRSFIRRLRDLASIAVPMVALMIRRSSEMGDALLARGYTLGKASSDFYECAPWRLIDWGVVAVSLLFLYFALGMHPIIYG